MAVPLVLFGWVLLLSTITVAVLKVIRRYPLAVENTLWSLGYSILKSWPIALWFSPGYIGSDMVGIPAPATFYLWGWLFLPNFRDRAIARNCLPFALISFFGIWFLSFGIIFFRTIFRLESQARKRRSETI